MELTQPIESVDILQFSEHFAYDEYRAYEVDESLLEKILSEEVTVEIRGENNSDCIVVTDSEAWELKRGEFTNTELLILPTTGRPYAASDDLKALTLPKEYESEQFDCRRVIDGAVTAHCVLLEAHPKMHLLKDLLKSAAFDGDDEEAGIDDEMLTEWTEIQDTVQGSDQQIIEEVRKMHAIKINGFYRLLDEQYWWSCLDEILDLILQNDLPIDKVDINLVISSVTDFPNEVVRHLLEYFAESQDGNIVKLDESRLCLFRGVQALAQHPNVSEEEFFQNWSDMVPYANATPEKKMLQGHALYHKARAHKAAHWERFEESELPIQPKKRFKVLFDKKEEWGDLELKPFLKGLIRPGLDMDKVLMKNTRIITSENANGDVVKTYKPRHKSYGRR